MSCQPEEMLDLHVPKTCSKRDIISAVRLGLKEAR